MSSLVQVIVVAHGRSLLGYVLFFVPGSVFHTYSYGTLEAFKLLLNHL